MARPKTKHRNLKHMRALHSHIQRGEKEETKQSMSQTVARTSHTSRHRTYQVLRHRRDARRLYQPAVADPQPECTCQARRLQQGTPAQKAGKLSAATRVAGPNLGGRHLSSRAELGRPASVARTWVAKSLKQINLGQHVDMWQFQTHHGG